MLFSASERNPNQILRVRHCDAPRAVAAVIAGGHSTRMGVDKSALSLGDQPLGMWSASALSPVCETRIQLGGSPILGLSWPLLADLRSECGPAGGIETGLSAFAGAALVVCAVDLPFVTTAATLGRRPHRRCTLARTTLAPAVCGILSSVPASAS